MEGRRQAQAKPDGGKDPLMEIYTIVGSVVVAVAIGLIGFHLAKDESSLRHKSMLSRKY